MTATTSDTNFLPSWKNATDPSDAPPLRVFDEDGSVHLTQLKKLSLSARQYLAGVNLPFEPTRAMRIGTIVHHLVLGPRVRGKPLVKFKGETRRGKEWDAFVAANAAAEIATAPEWREAEAVAEAVLADPLARDRLAGARCEVPLKWEDGGIKCSTDGVDMITLANAIGDLKSTQTTHPETFQRHAFKMLYPQQMAFYMRGARANGIDVSHGAFILGVETKVPFEIVDLELTEGMLDFADRNVSLWLERLRVLIDACPEPRSFADWPGYVQSPIPWDVPPWMAGDADDDGDADDGDAGEEGHS